MLFQGIVGAKDSERLTVYTVNYPLQYFAQRIAGPHAEVVFPASVGVDPAFWQPDIDTIIQYQQADRVLLNGAGYARWVNNVSMPQSRLVDTSAGFRDDYIEITTVTTHSHGPGGDHSHAGTAFTTWLDFNQALEQARVIRDALIKERPDHGDDFKHGFNTLAQELMMLDSELKSIPANHTQPVLASHPVYQYLGRGYGLDIRSVTWEPDEVPSAAQWTSFESLLSEHPARLMLWEDAPARETVKRLQDLGVEAVVFKPCANKPGQGDFMSVMRQNLQDLNEVLDRTTTR